MAGKWSPLLDSVVITLLVTSLVIDHVTCGYNSTFEWRTSQWSGCVYREQGSCCKCRKTRNVTCTYKDSDQQVAPFYCRKLRTKIPATEKDCSPCQQDCVLSTWSEWSTCSQTCSPSTRYRSRHVLLQAAFGGNPCENLAELDECRNLPLCTFIDPRPSFSWKIDGWSSCRQISNQSDCGTGRRYRAVVCVDQNSQPVADEFCQYYMIAEPKPPAEEKCPLACDCELTEWSNWGPCSKSCYKGVVDGSGYQARVRHVMRPAQEGGVGCDVMKESRQCDVNKIPACVRYKWLAEEWGTCFIEGEQEGCGSGVQTRRISCRREADSTNQARQEALCLRDSWSDGNNTSVARPNERRACQVPCSQDCQLGEWQNWGQCTKSCGPGGVRIRIKPILVEPTGNGKECGVKLETTGCETVPCSWWHTGRWSTCFLDGPLGSTCGLGTQIRTVYCLSSLDEVLPDVNCSLLGAKPQKERVCKVPCNSECLVSDWSSWTECSATCGPRGGNQFRKRKILAERSGPGPCLDADELEQTQTCNQLPCRTYLWQVSVWSPCIRMYNSSSPCGPGTGMRNRQVHCERDPGRESYPINDSFCEPLLKPLTHEVCDAPCPVDCLLSPWSEWSSCSHTCGRHSRKVRYRRILRLALHGGAPCPVEADVNGVIYHDKRCKKVPPCNEYSWQMSSWGMCTTLHGCGRGYMSRNVTCARDEIQTVPDDVCFAEMVGEHPVKEEACYRPCQGDCQLSEWASWSPCSQTCGNQPGAKSRSRYILNLDPHVTAESQCPDVEMDDLVEQMACGEGSCPTYNWEKGPWGTCVIHQADSSPEKSEVECGEGSQRRHVLCRSQSDGSYVPNHHCESAHLLSPDKQRACVMPCPEDCDVTLWTPWTHCSHSCGNGMKNRTRSAVVQPMNGGRACPHLEESSTCSVRDCKEFEWQTSQWRECQAFYGMPCGRGRRYRQVSCPAGNRFEYECMRRNAKPISVLECDVPCEGDCEISDWTEWSPCGCNGGNSTTARSRTILLHPRPGGAPCGPLLETKPCVCPRYHLEVGSWSSCQLESAPETSCGDGKKYRPINCLRDDGILVSLSYCLLGNTTLSETCKIRCPRDCELSLHTPWSACSATCGSTAMKQRHREIIRKENDFGRPCPDKIELTQTTTCHAGACYTYDWTRNDWGECSISKTQCGTGTMSRTVRCLRNDRVTADDMYCLKQSGLSSIHVHKVGDLTSDDLASLDLEIEAVCGTPCPGDCQLSAWSEWGQCFTDCGEDQSRGLQSRSRVIIKSPRNGGKCPNDLMEQRYCSKKDALCPLFAWRTSNWNKKGKRKVYCSLQGGTRVMSGCIREQKPSTHIECQEACAEFSSCMEGECVCDVGFRGDGDQCLPDYGCINKDHCVINSTFCDTVNKECLCWDHTLPSEDLTCPPQGLSTTDREDIEGLNELFVYILIGCLILLLILALVATCFLVKRRKTKKKPEKNKYNYKVYNSPTLTKIDNLEANQKNNEVGVDTPLMYKSLNRSEIKNMSRDPSQKSPFSTYRSNLSGGDDTESTTPFTQSPGSTPKKPNVDVDISLLDLDQDLFRDPDEMVLSPPRVISRRRKRNPDDTLPSPGATSGDESDRGHPHHLTPHSPDQDIIRVPSNRSIGSDNQYRLSTFKPDDGSPPPDHAPPTPIAMSPEEEEGDGFRAIEPQPGRRPGRVPPGGGYPDELKSSTLPRSINPNSPRTSPKQSPPGYNTMGTPRKQHPGSPPYRGRRRDSPGSSPKRHPRGSPTQGGGRGDNRHPHSSPTQGQRNKQPPSPHNQPQSAPRQPKVSFLPQPEQVPQRQLPHSPPADKPLSNGPVYPGESGPRPRTQPQRTQVPRTQPQGPQPFDGVPNGGPSTGRPDQQGPHQATISYPPHHRGQKPSIPSKPRALPKPLPAQKQVATPGGEVQYSPEETANLLEYCDELLADLERVANS